MSTISGQRYVNSMKKLDDQNLEKDITQWYNIQKQVNDLSQIFIGKIENPKSLNSLKKGGITILNPPSSRALKSKSKSKEYWWKRTTKKICIHWLKKKCLNKNCHFAHGKHEQITIECVDTSQLLQFVKGYMNSNKNINLTQNPFTGKLINKNTKTDDLSHYDKKFSYYNKVIQSLKKVDKSQILTKQKIQIKKNTLNTFLNKEKDDVSNALKSFKEEINKVSLIIPSVKTKKNWGSSSESSDNESSDDVLDSMKSNKETMSFKEKTREKTKKNKN